MSADILTMGVLKCAVSQGHGRRPMVARKNTACGARRSGGRPEQQNKPAQQNGARSRGSGARSAHAPTRSRAQRGKAARTLTAAHVIASAETTSPAHRPARRLLTPPRTAVNVDSPSPLSARMPWEAGRAHLRNSREGGVAPGLWLAARYSQASAVSEIVRPRALGALAFILSPR